MARGERERPATPLPAPYRNPWSGLAEALRAVAADRRLALQRLWRRNRDGELPLPAFWPRDLAPLFWPLVLSVVLALLVGLGGWLQKGVAARSTSATHATAGESASIAPPAVPGLAESQPEKALPPQARSAGLVGGEAHRATAEPPATAVLAGGSHNDSSAPPRPGTASASRSGHDPAPGAASPPFEAALADGGPSAEDGPGTTSRPEAPATELRLDPLLELLGPGEDAALLLAARPDPAASRLSLTLAPAAEALPQAELLERAQRWQQRAREAGYERLELRDPQGRLRGRGALVGSGMILLAPVPAA